MLNEPRERMSDGPRRGALYHVLYNMSNSFCYLPVNHDVSCCTIFIFSLFSTEITGPIFTKILHDIVALVASLNHAYTRRYPIPFLNARPTKVGCLPFFSQNWLEKEVQIDHLHLKRKKLSFAKRLRKSVQQILR